MTDAQYNAWLIDPKAIRQVLLEPVVRPAGAGADVTRYLSTGNFVTGPTDTPSNQFYLPMAVANISATETLTLDNSATMSVGDIEIHNPAGERDSWLDDVWVNRALPAVIGDPHWPRSDYRTIFNGVTADIASKSRDKLSLKLRDKLQRLNTALSEVKLKDIITDPAVLAALSNKDAILPLCFGECHNITPLLVDPAQLEYMVHYGPIEAIKEVRDNGIPVSFTQTVATGRFKLLASPAGAVTVSVQGAKPAGTWLTTVAALIQHIVTSYGKATDRFTAADLDTAQLAAFDAAHQQPVGLYIADRTNVINACQQLASSIGAQIVMSRPGQLRILQIDLTAPVSTFTVKPYQILERELSIDLRTDVVAAIKLGFCKNWTLQPGLQTSLSAADKELFDTEWLTSTQIDATVRSLYKLSADPVQIDTLLLRRVDADAEAVRLLNLRKVPRAIYKFTSFAEMLTLELGQVGTLIHPRFGLAAGKVGMVVSLTPNWANGRVVVGILV